MTWPNAIEDDLIKAAVHESDVGIEAWHRVRNEVIADFRTDASWLRMAPLLFRNLATSQPDDEFIAELEPLWWSNWYRNERGFRAVGPVIQDLENAGLSVVLLKGAPMAVRYYGDVGCRPMADVDIMVRPADAAKTIAMLHDAGWQLEMPARTGLYGDGRLLEWLLRHRHSMGFVHPELKSIDLHWQLAKVLVAPYNEAISDVSPFFARARAVEFGGAVVHDLAASDLLLNVVLHGVTTSPDVHLRWVVDALLLIASEPDLDWDCFVAEARGRHVVKAATDSLEYLATKHGAAIPKSVLEELGATPSRLADKFSVAVGNKSSSVARAAGHFARFTSDAGFWRTVRSVPQFVCDATLTDRLRDIPSAAAHRWHARDDEAKRHYPAAPKPTSPATTRD